MSKAAATDPEVFTFFNEIGIIAQLSRAAFEETLPKGLKVSHFSVLNHLVRLGDGVTPSHLANAFQVTKAAMTNTLGKLEERRLVKVKPDAQDGRSKRVHLTPAGAKARNACIAALSPLLATTLETIPANEFHAALPFLQKLRMYLDAARD
jgi:DNA-binding MarR family transcriptional regulator